MNFDKINMIVWSRNRACQLFLLIQSTKKYFKNINKVFVLYKADNDFFEQGYQKTKQLISGIDVDLIPETNFQQNIKDILINKVETPYVVGNSDDNVFINNVDFPIEYKMDDDCAAFSLRLGLNINYCFPAKMDLVLPEFVKQDDKFLKWDWRKHNPRGGWGYPHPCDSHIYLRSYWIDLIKNGSFSNPRQLEDWMNTHRDNSYPYMQSFTETKLVSIQANQLGQGADIPTTGVSVNDLNQSFLNNYVIDTSNIYDLKTNMCHLLIKYNLRKN